MNNKKISLFFLVIGIILGLSGCSTKATNSIKEETTNTKIEQENNDIITNFSDLDFSKKLELKYAKMFDVSYCEGYYLITINNSDKYLVIEEGSKIIENIPQDIVVINKTIKNSYVVSSSVMDLIYKVNNAEGVSLSGIKEEGWYIDNIKKLMTEGKISYAGKYNAPDYELILSKKCDLAIENTMIYHNPEVKEKLEELGIPVLVEYSSYEEHPLGRLEWIKLYGILYNGLDKATLFFDEQLAAIENDMKKENTGLKVAFFYINGNKAVNVRKPNDYIAKMINMAGGEYVITEIEESENSLSTVNMQMEEFYKVAKDADIIIYNSTIDGELNSIDELLSKSELLNDFKAVKNDRVYCTGKNLFQETTSIGKFIVELNHIINDDSIKKLEYIYKLE